MTRRTLLWSVMLIGVLSLAVAPDTVRAAGDKLDPIAHVLDGQYVEIPWPNAQLMKKVYLPTLATFEVAGVEVKLALTKHVLAMWVVSIVLIIIVLGTARKVDSTRISSGGLNLLEFVITWMRDNITVPTMGPYYGRKLLPYMLSLFLFILFCNLFGLIPYGTTATANLGVTAAMALLSLIVIQLVVIHDSGIIGYLRHLTAGVHPALWILMVPIEIVGQFTKPFALAIRLFANMTAGHIIIMTLLGLIFVFGHVASAMLAVPFTLFIYLIELLVALLQAVIFTILTCVFAGAGIHSDHGAAHTNVR